MQTIAIFQHPTLGPSVSGRELYPLITESKSARFLLSDWFRGNQTKYDFKDGVDFIEARVHVPGHTTNRAQVEFILTLATAKTLCLHARKGRGKALYTFLQNAQAGTTAGNTAAQAEPLVLPFVDSMAEVIPDLPVIPAPESTTTPRAEVIPADETPGQQLLRMAQKLVEDEQRGQKEGGSLTERVAALERARAEDIQTQALIMGKLDALFVFLQSAAMHLQPLTPVDMEPVPTRVKINRLVDAYAAAKGVEHGSLWRNLYTQLRTRTGFDVYAHANGRRDNFLEVIEQRGQIDNLYTIAAASLSLTAKPTPPLGSN